MPVRHKPPSRAMEHPVSLLRSDELDRAGRDSKANLQSSQQTLRQRWLVHQGRAKELLLT